MKDSREFMAFWVVNSITLYFLPYLFAAMITTGNVRLTPFMAAIIAGFLLSVIDAITIPGLNYLKIRVKDDWQRILAYLLINVLGIWLLARYADLTGIGVASAWVAIMVGAIINLLQWIVWKLAKI